MSKLSRHDFLKLLLLAAKATLLSSRLPILGKTANVNDTVPNIIVFIFDAMTARNLSLYGYQRKTTPNIENFAQKATGYLSHYANANFTVRGTSSILTEIHPWTHHAINQAGLIARNLLDLFRKDKWHPLEKPKHRLGDNKGHQRLIKLRQRYDEYIANVDFEFGRLLGKLDNANFLDQSYIILTSDHGQMFEQGWQQIQREAFSRWVQRKNRHFHL